MSLRLHPIALTALLPFLLAWSGGGDGPAFVKTGSGQHAVHVNGVFQLLDRASIVLNGPVGDGEGLVFIGMGVSDFGKTIRLPDSRVSVAYREYGPDGRLRFRAVRPMAGTIRVDRLARWAHLELSADWRDLTAVDQHRAWTQVEIELNPTGGASRPDGAHEHESDHHSGAGCDSTVYAEPEPEPSSGCEGDDWDDGGDDWSDDSSGWDDSSSGSGCEGDDLDSGGSDWDDSSSSGGGCEGDDTSSASDSPSCEGDAVASIGPRTRRSATAIRIVNQMPWLLVLVGLSMVRRRRPR